jgi:uncharacterized protein (DUF1501 family)
VNPTRRTLLKLAGALALAQGLPVRHLWARPRRARARYFVQLQLAGGIDAIYTTDPRVAAEVDSRVDVPYGPEAIVEVGHMRLGPHLAGLAPVCDRLAILNGVRFDTANHSTGTTNLRRLRQRAQVALPTVLELCAMQVPPLQRAPFAVMETVWLDGSFDELFAASPARLAELADALSEHADAAQPRVASHRGRATLATYRDAAALAGKLVRTPRLRVEAWSDDPDQQAYAAALQRLLWLLQHDLTTAVFYNLENPDWDTHTDNGRGQPKASGSAFPMIARFLSELHKRSNEGGTLFDQAAVVMGSEIGRFPQLNSMVGKDHFPEAPVLLYGAAFEPVWGQQLGAVGRQMESLTVSPRNGRFERGGLMLCLDDIGATLLALAGVDDPSVYGYARPPLPFVLA